MARPKLPLVVRFVGRVRATSGGCWAWTGEHSGPRRGARIVVAGSDLVGGRPFHASALRVAYRLFRDRSFPIRGGSSFQAVRRTCGNLSCVNPAHLEVLLQG